MRSVANIHLAEAQASCLEAEMEGRDGIARFLQTLQPALAVASIAGWHAAIAENQCSSLQALPAGHAGSVHLGALEGSHEGAGAG